MRANHCLGRNLDDAMDFEMPSTLYSENMGQEDNSNKVNIETVHVAPSSRSDGLASAASAILVLVFRIGPICCCRLLARVC